MVNRGTMGVSSLPKTVTQQRRDYDLNPGPSAPESSTLTTRLPSHPHTDRHAHYNTPLRYRGRSNKPWLWLRESPRPRRPLLSAAGPAAGRPCCNDIKFNYQQVCRQQVEKHQGPCTDHLGSQQDAARCTSRWRQLSVDIWRPHPGCGKPAAHRCCCRSTGQTDGRTDEYRAVS